jgi:peroxiredoxin
MEFYDKYRDYGFEIVAIDLYRTEIESTREYVTRKGIKYPILIANDDVLRRYGGINTTPVMFLLDRSGRVVEVFQHFSKSDLYHMENRIRRLLALEPLPLPKPVPPMNLAILKDNKAPDFSLLSLDGKTITLSRLPNKVKVLVFWSIDDIVSIGILSFFQSVLYKKYHYQDVEIIGVHINLGEEAQAKAASFIKTNQIEIPVVQATPELIKQYGNITTPPVIILIDQYGFIREIYEKVNYEIVSLIEDKILLLLKIPPRSPEVESLQDPALIKIKELMEIKCARCHSLKRVLLRNKTKEEWSKTVYRMREKQVDWISEEEAQDIIRYLSQFYSQ